MKAPKVALADVDWDAVRAALANFGTSNDEKGALARLNAATAKVLPNIATSPVPVLLPFDTAAYLRDSAQGSAGDTSKYLSGFSAVAVFFPGRPATTPRCRCVPIRPARSDIRQAREVQISGSALVYELDGPMVADGEPVPQLDSQFPGIRRSLIESHLRYTFVRFGVPYVISIGCFDGPASARRLSCREADKVALRFLKASMSPAERRKPAPQAHAADDRSAGTDLAGLHLFCAGRHPSRHRLARPIRPRRLHRLRENPLSDRASAGLRRLAVVHELGQLRPYRPGRARRPRQQRAYRCRVNDKPLVNDEAKNFAYPWRDNFCEHRDLRSQPMPRGLGPSGPGYPAELLPGA